MKTPVGLLFLLGARLAFAGAGDLVGYEETEARLRARLFVDLPACIADDAQKAFMARFDREVRFAPEEYGRYGLMTEEFSLKPGFLLAGVLGDFKPDKTNIAHLLGTRYSPDIMAFSTASARTVNALNSFAWETLLRALSLALGAVCTQTGTPSLVIHDATMFIEQCRTRAVPLNEDLVAILKDLCRPSLDAKLLERRAADLFELVTDFSYPDAERDAWLAEVTRPEYATATPATRVGAMFRTILLNPYFVLQY